MHILSLSVQMPPYMPHRVLIYSDVIKYGRLISALSLTVCPNVNIIFTFHFHLLNRT